MTDPLLGELTWHESRPDTLVGIALLSPKHPVAVRIDVPASSDDEETHDVIAQASELFATIRLSDWDFRLGLAGEFSAELEGLEMQEYENSTQEAIARLFSMQEVFFREPGLGVWVGYFGRMGGSTIPGAGVEVCEQGPIYHLYRPF